VAASANGGVDDPTSRGGRQCRDHLVDHDRGVGELASLPWGRCSTGLVWWTVHCSLAGCSVPVAGC
jgi:hypothetical protein